MAKTKLYQARDCYIARCGREENPAGSFDRGGRWYPDEEEQQECCEGVRSPSRAHPYSLLVHCRTLRHVAQLFGVDEKDLRKAVRRKEPARKPRRAGGTMYKLVAVRPSDGAMVSIFDGKTEYRLGETLCQRPRQGHNGGYYVYETPEAARRGRFPFNSKGINWSRALLAVRAEGAYCRYKGYPGDPDKFAFARITPERVVF